MLLAVDPMVRLAGEDFINQECVAITAVFPTQALYIFGTELDAPQPDGFVTDRGYSLGQRSSMSQ
ncbi:MAG: hypothetical protein ACJA09_003702 [Alcanivorax sp.]|jgi:hypothetical protein